MRQRITAAQLEPGDTLRKIGDVPWRARVTRVTPVDGDPIALTIETTAGVFTPVALGQLAEVER